MCANNPHAINNRAVILEHLERAERKPAKVMPVCDKAHLMAKAKRTPNYNPSDEMLDAMFNGVPYCG